MKNDVKRNILILNHHASAPDTGGGGRHYKIGKLLSEKGHKVILMASSYDSGRKKYHFSDEVAFWEPNDNFQIIRIKTKPAYKNIITRFLNYNDFWQ